MARHRKLAQDATRTGDLAAAATQWQILTLIAPRDQTFKRELAATHAALSRTTADAYQAGLAA